MNLRLAAPAMFLAALLLLPFVNKPYTIDDPLFIREAKHALLDPAHPADFVQVWNAGERLKLSQYLVGGTLPAYVLAPVAALGAPEWLAHVFQFLLLCVLLMAGVAIARRLGCDRKEATMVGLLVASNPVTLAMASTCMPDVMAVAFGMWGIERVLAFREGNRWAGIAGGVLLAAGVLCRASTMPFLVVAAMYVWKGSVRRVWPVAIAAVLVAANLVLARGADVGSSFESLTSFANAPRNLIAYLCYAALTGPILLYAMLSLRWRFAAAVAAVIAAGVALSASVPSANVEQYAVPAAAAVCFLVACWWIRGRLDLWVWLGSGLVALPYVHMAAKYLLPGVPAAALLIVLHGAGVRQQRFPLTLAILVVAGWISGSLIVVGDTTLATSQREAANRMVAPRVKRGVKVWAGGQWAFLAYAEEAGAKALANTPPLPQPGEEIVVSRLDYYGMLNRLPIHKELLNTQFDRRCGVFVLNRRFHAGFYSIRFGYLPFAIGCGELNAYDLYRVLP